jgi:hypothetical protein
MTNFLVLLWKELKLLKIKTIWRSNCKLYWTIELDDATSYALLHRKCHEKLGTQLLQFYNDTVHEDPLLDKGWIAITDFYVRQKKYQKSTVLR